MKLVSDKNNKYVFRSYLLIFNLISIYLICGAAKLYFDGNNLKKSLICIVLALVFSYFGTIYCKIIFDLNNGIVYCSYFWLFSLTKCEFAINDIKEVKANVIRKRSGGSVRVSFSSLSIHTISPDNDFVASFQLGGQNIDKLHKSVELMNSLLDQYKQSRR